MVKQTQIVFGCGVLTVGALILYLALKRRKTTKGTGEPDTNSSAEKPKSIEEAVLEFTLPNIAIPFVVGKNEEILRTIELATGTKIEFCEQDSSHQLCKITGGDGDALARAQEMVKEKADHPPILLEELAVPSTAGHRIIGLCGERLEEICNTSEAKVWIEKSDSDGKIDTVKITGTQAQINAARVLIEAIVKEDSEIRNRDVKVTTPSPKDSATPSRITQTPEPREVKPPTTELLNPANSSGQLEVYVSAVAHPSKFFVQIVGPQSAELDLLIDAMTEYYSDEENQKKHVITEATLGQLVAARFQDDDRWYRAEIVEMEPNAVNKDVVCDLFFLDYGDNQYVLPKDIYALKSDFLSLKYQAIECFLAYVKPNNPEAPNSWPQKANNRFDELTHVAQWKKLISKTVTFRSSLSKGTQIPGVELFDIENGHDINIGQQMIAEGLALPSTSGYFGDLVNSSVLKLQPDNTILEKGGQPSSVFRLTPDTTTLEKVDDASQPSPTPTPSPPPSTSAAPEPNTDHSTKNKTKIDAPEADLFNVSLNKQNNNAKSLDEHDKRKEVSADFLLMESKGQMNGNTSQDLNSNSSSDPQTSQPEVKMWSDLLKND